MQGANMKKYIDGFNGLLLGVMFLITLWQIIARFIPGNTTVWSEEVARFVFVWIVFLGAATLMRDNEHIRISIVTDRLGPVSGRILKIFSATLIIPFIAFAPTVDWLRLGYVYLALLLSGIIMIGYLSRNLVRDLFPSKFSP